MQIPPQLQTLLELLYGADKWYRIWAMVMTGCLVLCIPKGTRRLGGIMFIAVGVCAIIWNFLQTSYKQFTPESDRPTIATPPPKKWLR